MAGQFSPRKRAQQQKLFDKKAERAEVKKYGKGKDGETHDQMNLRHARDILSWPRGEVAEFYFLYAIHAMNRLGTEEEKAVLRAAGKLELGYDKREFRRSGQ